MIAIKSIDDVKKWTNQYTWKILNYKIMMLKDIIQ